MKPTIISVVSRKGGVGKTSIALSAAVQLAAKGKKVALIDLDMQGSHLSQCLPLDRDTEQSPDGKLFFQAKEFTSASGRSYKYRDRPFFIWSLINGPKDRGRIPVTDVECHLAISEPLRERARQLGVTSTLNKVRENLGIFPNSCYLRDINAANDSILTVQGQETYQRWLNRKVSELESAGYEFLIFDNSPGFSFNPGVGLAWAMKLAQASQYKVRTWIVSGAPWWEQALIGYEINVYASILAATEPTIIVNRVDKMWLGRKEFEVGERFKLTYERPPTEEASPVDLAGIGNEQKLDVVISRRLFGIPIWISASKRYDELYRQFVLPHNLSIAILGFDNAVEDSMKRPEDRAFGKDYLRAGEENASGERKDVLSDPYYVWANWADEFLRDFVLPSIQGTSPSDGTFHRHVYTALVERCLKE